MDHMAGGAMHNHQMQMTTSASDMQKHITASAHDVHMNMATNAPDVHMHTMQQDQNAHAHAMNSMGSGGSMVEHMINMSDGGYNIVHDHNGMQHSAHSQHLHAHHAAYFHTQQDDIILFKEWQLSPGKVTFLSCLALVVIAVLYQALKTVRQRLGRRCRNIQCKRYILNRNHLIQTVLYLSQFVVGYFVMLAVMTYSVWILIATVLGLGLGYFCFGWRDYEHVGPFPMSPRRQRTFAADCSNSKSGEQELLPLGSETCDDVSGGTQTASLACSCDHVVG